MAARKKKAPRTRKKASSRGLTPAELAESPPPAEIEQLAAEVAKDGGVSLGMYREPLAGDWLVVAGLPVDKVDPTPYQRDLSPAHVKRLQYAIEQLGRFLDPIIVVRQKGAYWTPNGHHRLAAMRRLGARTIIALVVPDPAVAHRILLLNTEKAHGLKERALEVTRLAEALAKLDDRLEPEYEIEFEEPSLITLGLAYDKNPRLAGATYHSVLKRLEAWYDLPVSKALVERRARAKVILALDEAVGKVVDALKERGFQSPYLRPFVIARINPLRWKKGPADFDETMATMLAAAKKFDAAKVKQGQIQSGGGSDE
ncbi:MAG TPA: ParB N-terminal domain-containing protein [Gemmatimonadales bacterium]|jgi:ParB family chromosome partitioning protein